MFWREVCLEKHTMSVTLSDRNETSVPYCAHCAYNVLGFVLTLPKTYIEAKGIYMRVRYPTILVTLVGLVALFALIAPIAFAQNGYNPGDTCPAMVNQALAQVGNNCANLSGNTACYGFGGVNALLSENSTVTFAQPADRVALNEINGLRTTPLNADTGSLGVALLNVTADGALANGLNVGDVKYVLFGEVELSNVVGVENTFLLPANAPMFVTTQSAALRISPGASAPQVIEVAAGSEVVVTGVTPDSAWMHANWDMYSAWLPRTAFDATADISMLPLVNADGRYPMQAFQFTTVDETVPGCESLPPSLLILQAPRNVAVDVLANGARIRFTNTIFLRTTREYVMEIINISGDVTTNVGLSNQTTFRAGGALAAPLNATGRVEGEWTNFRTLGRSETEGFAILEALPENILNAAIAIPAIINPSGPVETMVFPTDTPPFVVTPPPPTRPPFPRPPLDPGPGGQELPSPPWQGFTIGPRVCPAWIVHHTDRTGDWELFRLGTIANSVSENLSQGINAGDIQPTRSDDAEWIAFTTNRDGGNWEIYVGRTDGSERRRVSYNTAVDINPVWNYGNIILFESNRDANWELYTFDVSTGVFERLTNDPNGSDVDAEWNNDNTMIVWSSNADGDYELYTMPYPMQEGVAPTRLTDNDTDDIGAQFSNDGTKLAWLQRNEVGVYDLIVRDLLTGEDKKYIDLGADVNLNAWAPSDRFIAWDSNVDGDYDVFAVEIEENAEGVNEIKNVTNNLFQDRAPSFRCNSDIIIYQSDSPGQFDIFDINPDPIDPNGPFNVPNNLTNFEPATDIYAMNQPLDEDGSREGRLP